MIKSLRDFPSVEEVLSGETVDDFIERLPRSIISVIVKRVIAEAKADLQSSGKPLKRESFNARIRKQLSSLIRKKLTRIINGTGTVIHTNLGRAPLSPDLIASISESVSGYSNLEFDLATGKRGSRGELCEQYLACLAGAESATVVNNCAAALFIIVNSFSNRRSVVISRGELVQIGGGFRIPDILKKAGARLNEIGTTNITSLDDYRRAIDDKTALILKVHRSNFAQSGFTDEPELKEMVSLASENQVILVNDLGSGSLVSTRAQMGHDEPTVQQSVRAGADLTCFSGDKLLGGMQAGLIVGKAELINRIKKNPLFRTIRVDKIVFSALEQLLETFLAGSHESDIPLWNLLSIPESELYKRAKSLLNEIGQPPEVVACATKSYVGGGAMPGSEMPSVALSFSIEISANKLMKQFRECEPAIIGRIENDRFMIDLKAIDQADLPVVRDAITKILQFHRSKSRK